MSRYKTKRELVDWSSNRLRVVKQLAGAIKKFEACGTYDLWRRVDELLPAVSHTVLGERVTFELVREQVKAEQHKSITPNRLLGRADVVNREGYKETDHFTEPVIDAYLSLTNGKVVLDIRRFFTNDEVRIAVVRQQHTCFNPACRAPFTELNPPVGDHAMPWSRGGLTIQANCVALCYRCNSQKGDMTLHEFIAKCGMTNARARRLVLS